jgi:hypothetical protein
MFTHHGLSPGTKLDCLHALGTDALQLRGQSRVVTCAGRSVLPARGAARLDSRGPSIGGHGIPFGFAQGRFRLRMTVLRTLMLCSG